MVNSILATEAGRRCALAAILTLTENTSLAPSRYELELLDRFVWGELTLDEVEARLRDPFFLVGSGQAGASLMCRAFDAELAVQGRLWTKPEGACSDTIPVG